MKKNKKFTIIFQGQYNSKFINNILFACQHSDDVILSTWRGGLDDASRGILEKNNIKIIECDDPGSILAYLQDGTKKSLNIKRMLTGVHAAGLVAKYEHLIKTRMDITLNYSESYEKWVESEKNFFSINVTSNCPYRLFGYPYLFCISDWCFGLNRKKISLLNPVNIDEQEFILNNPIVIKDVEWHVRVGAEQILTLLLAERIDLLEIYRNESKLNDIAEHYHQEHQEILRSFLNLRRDFLSFKSHKYRAIGVRWLNYDSQDFKDNGLIKIKLHQLILFMVSFAIRKLRMKFAMIFA